MGQRSLLERRTAAPQSGRRTPIGTPQEGG